MSHDQPDRRAARSRPLAGRNGRIGGIGRLDRIEGSGGIERIDQIGGISGI